MQRRGAAAEGHAARAVEDAATDRGATGGGRAEAVAAAATVVAAAATAAAAVVVPLPPAALLAVLPLHVRLLDRFQVFSTVVTARNKVTVRVDFAAFSGIV